MRLIRDVQVDWIFSNSRLIWQVTFLSEYPSLHGKIIKIKAESYLVDRVDGTPHMNINVLEQGSLPTNHKFEPRSKILRASFGIELSWIR